MKLQNSVIFRKFNIAKRSHKPKYIDNLETFHSICRRSEITKFEIITLTLFILYISDYVLAQS